MTLLEVVGTADKFCSSMNSHGFRGASATNESSGTISSFPMNSATLHLLKQVASGIPRIAGILGGILQELCWEDTSFAFVEGMHAQIEEIGSAARVILDVFSPYMHSVFNVLLPTDDFGDHYSYDNTFKEHMPKGGESSCWEGSRDRATSDLSDISNTESCVEVMKHNSRDNGERLNGLLFQNTDLFLNESSHRFDYIITQMDVSRMARTASRHLDVKSINHLPTITYHAHDQLIFPNYKGKNKGDTLQCDAPFIENNFSDIIENEEPSCIYAESRDDSPQFSWMVVPSNPNDDMKRLSNSFLPGAVPGSISICSSHHSCCNEKKHDIETFEFCVICQDMFQDGEHLRVLPCQHLFHCGCIDRWLTGESLHEKSFIHGCPMCKKKSKETSSQQASNNCDQESQEGAYPFDGSVPSWAFARLGDLLSSANNGNPSSS